MKMNVSSIEKNKMFFSKIMVTKLNANFLFDIGVYSVIILKILNKRKFGDQISFSICFILSAISTNIIWIGEDFIELAVLVSGDVIDLENVQSHSLLGKHLEACQLFKYRVMTIESSWQLLLRGLEVIRK